MISSLLKMSVQILFGRQDTYIPNRLLHPGLEFEELVKKATAQIHRGVYHRIEECDHFVQWEQPTEVSQQLSSFLQAAG